MRVGVGDLDDQHGTTRVHGGPRPGHQHERLAQPAGHRLRHQEEAEVEQKVGCVTSEECFVKVMFGENTNTHPRHDSSDQLSLSSPTPVSQQGPPPHPSWQQSRNSRMGRDPVTFEKDPSCL